MKTKRLQTVLVATATLLAALWSPSSTAQTYPTKPIRIVVPWSAGGSTDAIGRTLAARLSETIGQQVIVENKPGAGGTLGVDQVAKSTPDGYTLTVIELPHASAQALLSKVPYDLNTDLVAIAHLGIAPLVAPAKTPPEILEKLRTEVAIAMNHASLKERLAALSIEPPTMSPTQFQAYVGNEVKRWNKVARDANIRVED